jgi:hypothetical protein
MRKDGKFMVGDEIPDGQGRVTQLLEDCFELAYELRNDAERHRTRLQTTQWRHRALATCGEQPD